VVEGFGPLPGGLDQDGEVLPHAVLVDQIGQALGAYDPVEGDFLFFLGLG
jgi:hypothetical protein